MRLGDKGAEGSGSQRDTVGYRDQYNQEAKEYMETKEQKNMGATEYKEDMGTRQIQRTEDSKTEETW